MFRACFETSQMAQLRMYKHFVRVWHLRWYNSILRETSFKLGNSFYSTLPVLMIKHAFKCIYWVCLWEWVFFNFGTFRKSCSAIISVPIAVWIIIVLKVLLMKNQYFGLRNTTNQQRKSPDVNLCHKKILKFLQCMGSQISCIHHVLQPAGSKLL